MVHLAVRPSADEPFTALLVWLPGVVGLVAMLFSAVPDLVELTRYRLAVVGPATAVSGADSVVVPQPESDADAPTSPDPFDGVE